MEEIMLSQNTKNIFSSKKPNILNNCKSLANSIYLTLAHMGH